MVINDIFAFRNVISTEDDKVKLENCSTNLENFEDVNGYKLSSNITCRIAFDIYRKIDRYKHGKVFVESIDVDKYVNIFLNLYEFNNDITKRVISILEKSFRSKLIYVSTDPKNKEYHKVLEELNYIYQKDYIYPDVKLYFKEME